MQIRFDQNRGASLARRSAGTCLLSLSLAWLPSACGERLSVGDHTSGGASASAQGGSGGKAASAFGGSSGESATVQLPPAPHYCGELEFQYDGQGCSRSCPLVSCNCVTGELVLTEEAGPDCHPQLGCVVSMNCEASCARSVDVKRQCLTDRCPTDYDCSKRDGSENVCVRSDDEPYGFCKTLGSGDGVCGDANDCLAGQRCVVVEQDGTRICQSPESESYCNSSADCLSTSHCAIQPGLFRGLCTEGRAFEPCYRASDCLDGLRCIGLTLPEPLAPYEVGMGRCSDGLPGTLCELDDHCREGRCLLADGHTQRSCTSGKLGHFCAVDEDCESGICGEGVCSDGKLRSLCDDANDCDGGVECIQNRCSDRSVGSACLDPHECDSNICADFKCSDGSRGSPCDSARDCQSQVCELNEEQFGKRCG